MTQYPPSMDALEWLNALTPDTPEMRAIDREESTLIGLARTLRLAREHARLTQKELAQRLGVSQTQISKWENVNANHTMQSILSYLGALGTEPGGIGAAELVMAIRATDGTYLPVTPLAKWAVILEEQSHQELVKRAAKTGKNRRETIGELLKNAHSSTGDYTGGIRVEREDTAPVIPARRYTSIEFLEAA